MKSPKEKKKNQRIQKKDLFLKKLLLSAQNEVTQ